MAMFNFSFGMLMCTLTFGQMIGNKFAAKYPYTYRNTIVEDKTGLNRDERIFQECIWGIKDKVIEKIDQEHWR